MLTGRRAARQDGERVVADGFQPHPHRLLVEQCGLHPRIVGQYHTQLARIWVLGLPLHRDLVAYAEILARQTGQPFADPMKLIVPMLERFIATDREFAKARRAAG